MFEREKDMRGNAAYFDSDFAILPLAGTHPQDKPMALKLASPVLFPLLRFPFYPKGNTSQW